MGKNLVSEYYLKNIAFFLRLFKDYRYDELSVKDHFSWEPDKINVKFHKNCENTGKILKISCVRCHFVKFDIYSLRLPLEILLVGIHNHFLAALLLRPFCLLILTYSYNVNFCS